MKTRNLFITILILYITLPLIILAIPTLFFYKFYILTAVGVFIYFLFRLNKVTAKELGIKKENTIKSLKRNFPLIAIMSIAIIFSKLFNLNRFTPTETIGFYIFYVFVSCPIQEFLYRGVFGYFEKKFPRIGHWMIVIASFCYSLVHIIYKDIFTLLITFLIGLIWYYLYRKDYNLLGISISHAILGIMTILLGIID